jgi:hypothetical protein
MQMRLPERAPTIAQLLEWVDGADLARACAATNSLLVPKGRYELLRDGRGVPAEVVITFDLFRHAKPYASCSFSIGHREADAHLIPPWIGWRPTGEPWIRNPLEELYHHIADAYLRIHLWAREAYTGRFAPDQVAARLADQLQGDVARFLAAKALNIGFPAASTLVRIDPYPSHLMELTIGGAEQEFECKKAAVEKVKALWPDRLDVAACSQSKPLITASLAVNGRSTLVTATPFNGRYLPERRSGIVRSIQFHRPLVVDPWRVRVQGQRSPFEEGSVRLLTVFARTRFNSLDAQGITPAGIAKLASCRTERLRLVNPRHLSLEALEEPVIWHRGQRIAYNHEGLATFLAIPENAHPIDHPEQVGCAEIIDFTVAQTHHGGQFAPVYELTYRFVQPCQTTDKLISPHSIKGVANEVEFECEVFVGGRWRTVEVITDGGQNDLKNPDRKKKGFEKRGPAVVLHGRLELLCEEVDESCELPADVLWQQVPQYLGPKARARWAAGDPILTGQVPIRYRLSNGEWHQAFGDAGLIPWIRTKNSTDISQGMGHHTVPVHAITYASCLRRWRIEHPDQPSLMNWLLSDELSAARATLDLLSIPCVDHPTPGTFTLYEGGRVYYRGEVYEPIPLTVALQTVGMMSMEVLRAEEQGLNPGYPNSILDPRVLEKGALIPLRCNTKLPGGRYTRRLFLPPEFCAEYLKLKATEPVTGRPIIQAVAHWFNAWIEIQDRAKDPTGSRTQIIPSRLFQLLADDLANRRGLITRSIQRRQPGIRYPNLAIDDCPPGVMWISEATRRAWSKLLGRPIEYGEPVLDVRFPVEPQTGLQGYTLAPMPARYRAQVITNAATSEDHQDGDNDGDGKSAFLVPPEHWAEVLAMRDLRPAVVIPEFKGSTYAINSEDIGPEYQLEEAFSTGSIKAEIGVVSALEYRHILAQDWRTLDRATISAITTFWSAVLHSAVKKDLDARLTWALQGCLADPNPQQVERISQQLEVLYRHKSDAYRAEMQRGFRAVVAFQRRYPNRKANRELVSMVTINAPQTNCSPALIEHLKERGTDRLLAEIQEQLVYGAR